MEKEKKYLIDNPTLMAEWNYEKNNELGLNPETVTFSSHKKAWWKCEKGHEWQATIDKRNKGRGCPYCSNHKVLKGFNDLATINAKLASEWNYDKNGDLTPENISAGSSKKVWWKCKKGHEWQATINSRNRGNGCPHCSGRNIDILKRDLIILNPTLAKEWNWEKNIELGLNPKILTQGSNKKAWWKCEKGHEWIARISSRLNGTQCPICSGKKVLKGYNDLATINPELAKEWDFEKNGNLTPKDFVVGSNVKIWWKCSKGHEWQASIYTRNKGIGCPICKSERNTSFPEFAIIYYLKKYGLGAVQSYKQLGYELDVFIPSKKIAIEYDGFFWHKNKRKKDVEKNLKCKMNGIKVYRIREGLSALNDSSIDYVIDKKQKKLSEVLKVILSEILGFCVDINLQRDNIEIENLREYTEKKNSLLFANPTLAKEWDYEKNGNLRPENFTVASEKKVWWKCNHGHEWQASIKSRNSGSGCPYCSGRCAINGKNDLATINPTLVKEWNYEKNGELKPEDFLPNSGKKVWWKCNHGHEWQAIIKSRNYGSGCPYCAGQKVIQGRNDLATVNPKLAREWNSKKNGDLKPEDFMPYSNKKVWWKCEKGHMWQATIARRSNGSGCPYCSGRKKPKE